MATVETNIYLDHHFYFCFYAGMGWIHSYACKCVCPCCNILHLECKVLVQSYIKVCIQLFFKGQGKVGEGWQQEGPPVVENLHQ